MITYALKECLINSFDFLTENEINEIDRLVQGKNLKVTLIQDNYKFNEKVYDEVEFKSNPNVSVDNISIVIIYRNANIKIGKKVYKNEKLIKEEKTIINPNKKYAVLKITNNSVDDKSKYELIIYE